MLGLAFFKFYLGIVMNSDRLPPITTPPFLQPPPHLPTSAGWLSAVSSLLHVYHCVTSEDVTLDFPLSLNLIACAGTAVFIVSNYPSMGWRSFKKTQVSHEESAA